jgi:hypothetical protein
MLIGEMFPSPHLTEFDLDGPTVVTVSAIAKEGLSPDSENPDFHWVIKFKESQLQPLNLTYSRAIVLRRILESGNTDDWIGRKIVLEPDPFMYMNGPGIRIKRYDGQDSTKRVQKRLRTK